MPKKHRIFSDVTSVSRGERISLEAVGLINEDGTVISWSRLAHFIVKRTLTQFDAKQLILIELERDEPRADLIRRIVSYLSYSEKEKTLEKIEKLLEGGSK